MKKHDEIIRLTNKLIKVPSITGDHKKCNRVLGVALKELSGFRYKNYESDKVKSLLFYNTNTFPKKFKLILNAHLDVVPAEEGLFKPKVLKNKLIGRGAYDMKAAGAVMLLTYKDLSRKVDFPLGLQLVTDEEVGGRNGTGYQVKRGVNSEFVIAGEPTDLKIGYKNRATYWIKLSTKGKSGHGAYPWKGKNALEILLKDIDRLKETYPNPNKQLWKTTVSVTKVSTPNETPNKIPAEAEAILDIRLVPKDFENIDNTIKSLISKNTRIEVLQKAGYHEIERENKYFKALKTSIKFSTGKTAFLLEKYGGNDLAHYSHTSATGVLFGPKGGGIHANNEWVDIDSLKSYYDILKDFILKLN